MFKGRNGKMKCVVFVLVCVLFFSGAVAVANPVSREITYGVGVSFNGAPVEFADDMRPFIMDGRTYLPVRSIAELTGLDVDFADGMVHLSNDGINRATPANDTRETINVWSYNDEVPHMVLQYLEHNPDFASRYDINITIIDTSYDIDDGRYQTALDAALQAGGRDAPHIYAAESAFVARYTQGDMSRYALPYSQLGIENLPQRLSDAQIAQYTIDIGSRNGEVVGLAYHATGGAVIYRRSLATDVWGNDDPAFVAAQIGPGWDRFMQAAEEMHAAGYSMVSSAADIWTAIRCTGGPWIVNGRLNIHPDRMAFFDYAITLYDNSWTSGHNSWVYQYGSNQWTDSWFNDMSENGVRPVFCFLGPAWLVNYVMANNAGGTYGDWAITIPPAGFSWGGVWVIPSTSVNDNVRDGVRELLEWITLDTSESGLQHLWASGSYDGNYDYYEPDTVPSAVVMSRLNIEIDFLGGQNMYDVFITANEMADGTVFTQYDDDITWRFFSQAMEYAQGNLTREEALAEFRTQVLKNLGIE